MAYMPRSVVDNRRPVATAKSKNTSTTFITERRRRRPRRGFVNIHASSAMQWPSLQLFEGKFSRGISSLFADEARNTYLCFVLICRVPFSCCGRVASPQAAVWAPAWAPRSATCEHAHNGASTPEATPEATPRLCTSAECPSPAVTESDIAASPHRPGHNDQERADMLIRGRRRRRPRRGFMPQAKSAP
jgi:hypothetical protein